MNLKEKQDFVSFARNMKDIFQIFLLKVFKFVWAENSVSSIRLLSNTENENLEKTGTSGVIH